jgi:hypothetical protein
MTADDNDALLFELERAVNDLRFLLHYRKHTRELHAWLHARLVGLRQGLRECAELEARRREG